MGKEGVAQGVDAAGGEVFAAVAFASGGEDEAAVALAVVAYAHIVGFVGVVLQLGVAAAVAVDLDIPAQFGVE